jgi:hypothetical protein
MASPLLILGVLLGDLAAARSQPKQRRDRSLRHHTLRLASCAVHPRAQPLLVFAKCMTRFPEDVSKVRPAPELSVARGRAEVGGSFRRRVRSFVRCCRSGARLAGRALFFLLLAYIYPCSFPPLEIPISPSQLSHRYVDPIDFQSAVLDRQYTFPSCNARPH